MLEKKGKNTKIYEKIFALLILLVAFLHFAYIQNTFIIGSAQENSILSNYNILESNEKILGSLIQLSSGTTIYDFIDHASEASWSSGAGALPFPGSTSDSRGFACYVNNAVLEDGSKWSKVLETHPQWVNNGWIAGAYPQQTIQSNTQLTVRIGFLSGATGTDGARFDVYFDEYRGVAVAPLRHTVLSYYATLDGKLDLITRNLNFIAGKKGNFVLYVNAGPTSNRDWAVWAEAKIETIPLPDLIITDIWQKDNRIYYKIKNIGDASVGAPGAPITFFDALFIDGKNVAKDYINTIIEPGKEIERYFDYDWHATLPKHVIKVCADYGNNVVEKDEGNNCREETWYLALPDLTVLSMSWTPMMPAVGQTVKFTIVVKNIGNATSGVCKGALWLFNVTKTIISSIDVPSLSPGEEKTLTLNWIPTVEGVHVIFFAIDYENSVMEANETNNELGDKINVMKALKPDLIVVDIIPDRNASMIVYVIKNIGEDIAKGGHSTTLYVNGKEVTHDLVSVDLKPGEAYKSWFKEYKWPECQNITVKVCADNYKQVEESNEDNNCLEKICVSTPIPISIVSGPKVIDVTQDSVTIVWTTNKESDSAVIYSDRSAGEWNKVYDAKLVKDHEIKITGLKPRTTYRFYVGSKDVCENVVVSKTMVFETISPPDKEKPSVTLFLPERLVGIVEITADASDNVGVGGVMFSIDGVIKFIDFSPPYVWICDTTLFSNGAHDFDAIAFDAAGNEATDIKSGTINNLIPDTNPPIVDIVKPDREWVHDLVQIEAIIQDTPPGYIQRVELYIDNVLVGRSIYPSFHINPLTGEVVTEPATSILTFTHLWNATGLEPSSEHTIEVKAWDNSGNYGHNSTRVKIFSIISIDEYLKMKEIGAIKIIDIEVTRNVVRHENWFDVSLTIRNIGNVALEHFDIRDPCMGFQAIALPMPATSRDTSVSYDRLTHRSLVRITPLMGRLNPGESWTFHYYAVPILFGSGRGFIRPHVIGGFETTVSFQCEGTDYHKIFRISQDSDNEDWDGNGRTELEDAFNSVDYLIITNPEKLFTNYPGDRNGVNLLLQEAAVLAKIKHGILGYIEGNPSPESIKILLAPHLPSSWYFIDGQEFFGSLNFFVKRLPAFRNGSDAYLLIIGEDTIVPAKDVIGTIWGGEKWNWDVVFCSDNYYADVVNDDGMPDLIVGRIVGENASEFFKPIDVSISVYLGLKEFNYLNVLAISGPEEKSESFVKDVENVSNMLGRQGFRVDRVHTDTYYITENFLRKVLIMDRGMDKAYVNSLNLAELLNLISIEEAEQLEANRRGGFYLRYRDTLWNFNNYANLYVLAQRAIAIKEKTLNKGVILWYGHGLAGGAAWADVLDSGENVPASIGLQLYTDYDGIGELSYVPIDFGRNCPIIFAWSCETGRYVKKLIPQPPSISTLPLYGMPEAFFHHGAAVYIGSTMTMGGSPTEESFIFFSRLKEYLESGRSIGLLFKDMKIAKHYYENRILKWDVEFAFEVNYYGDPKYGGQS